MSFLQTITFCSSHAHLHTGCFWQIIPKLLPAQQPNGIEPLPQILTGGVRIPTEELGKHGGFQAVLSSVSTATRAMWAGHQINGQFGRSETQAMIFIYVVLTFSSTHCNFIISYEDANAALLKSHSQVMKASLALTHKKHEHHSLTNITLAQTPLQDNCRLYEPRHNNNQFSK